MNKDDLKEFSQESENLEKEMDQKELHFSCPNCGMINQDDVIFICNRCDTKEMVYKDGFYLCPACLEKKDNNFMCANCDSTEVKLKSKI